MRANIRRCADSPDDRMHPFETVSRIAVPRHEWFVGGTLNACVNCIDRHIRTERRLNEKGV